MIEPKAWQALIGRGKPPKGLTAAERSAWHKAQSVAYCAKHWPALSLLASERCKVPHDGCADGGPPRAEQVAILTQTMRTPLRLRSGGGRSMCGPMGTGILIANRDLQCSMLAASPLLIRQ
jgi:hypothetical protein